MPLINVSYSKGAVPRERRGELVRALVDVLVRHHIAARAERQLREVTHVKVTEHDDGCFFVGDEEAAAPRYEVEIVVPADSIAGERFEGIVREMTGAVLALEGSAPTEADARRVWVFVRDVPDGRWGAGGVVVRAAWILRHLLRGHVRELGEVRRVREAGGAGTT